jgi:hypothetical protein
LSPFQFQAKNPTLLQVEPTLNKNVSKRVEFVCVQSFDKIKIMSIFDLIFNFCIPFAIAISFSLMTLRMVQRNRVYNVIVFEKQSITKVSAEIVYLLKNFKHDNNLALRNKPFLKKTASLECLKFGNSERNLRRFKSLPVLFGQQKSDVSFINRESLKTIGESTISRVKLLTKKTPKSRITIVILIFPLSFLLNSFPVYGLMLANIFSGYEKDFEKEIAKIFMLLNNSISIFLLITFGKQMRKAFLRLFCCRKTYNII